MKPLVTIQINELIVLRWFALMYWFFSQHEPDTVNVVSFLALFFAVELLFQVFKIEHEFWK